MDVKGAKKIDLILVSVKTYQLNSAIPLLRSFIDEDTIIISLLNGISSEEILERELNTQNIIHAYTVGTDAKKYDHKVTFTNNGMIAIGTPYPERQSVLHKTIDILSHTGFTIKVSDDIIRDLWWKFMLNTGINHMAALLSIPYGEFMNEHVQHLTKSAMMEAVTIANAQGIRLTEKDADDIFQASTKWGKLSKASMLQDIENGRTTEVEALSGELIKRGKRYNIPTPINEFLYHAVRYKEEKNQVGIT